MRIKLENRVRWADDKKAIPILEERFFPYEEYKDAYVDLLHLKNSELNKYVKKYGEDVELDVERMIKDKVLGITGIEVAVNGEDIPLTKELLLTLPYSAELSALQMSICTHIMEAITLTADEVKN